MKKLYILFSLCLLVQIALTGFSSIISTTTMVGAGVPTLSCSSTSANLGRFYVRNDAGAPNSSVYVCGKVSATKYAWELVQTTPPQPVPPVVQTASTPAVPDVTGTPGILLSDGSKMFWGNLPTGGSDLLNCVDTPGQCDVVTALLASLTGANHFTGLNTFDQLALSAASAAPASSTDDCVPNTFWMDPAGTYLYFCQAPGNILRAALLGGFVNNATATPPATAAAADPTAPDPASTPVDVVPQ